MLLTEPIEEDPQEKFPRFAISLVDRGTVANRDRLVKRIVAWEMHLLTY